MVSQNEAEEVENGGFREEKPGWATMGEAGENGGTGYHKKAKAGNSNEGRLMNRSTFWQTEKSGKSFNPPQEIQKCGKLGR